MHRICNDIDRPSYWLIKVYIEEYQLVNIIATLRPGGDSSLAYKLIISLVTRI